MSKKTQLGKEHQEYLQQSRDSGKEMAEQVLRAEKYYSTYGDIEFAKSAKRAFRKARPDASEEEFHCFLIGVGMAEQKDWGDFARELSRDSDAAERKRALSEERREHSYETIAAAYLENGGNKTKTAKALGKSRAWIYELLKRDEVKALLG
ncbi:MAG: hypothetical protein AB8B55_16340 [Mariniblastus sp.]